MRTVPALLCLPLNLFGPSLLSLGTIRETLANHSFNKSSFSGIICSMPLLVKNGQALLFIHVPKTGGSSVVSWFKAGGWRVFDHNASSIWDRNAPNYYRKSSPQHAAADSIELTYRVERLSGIFAFVRQPIDRLISEYRWRHRHRNSPRELTPDHFRDWWRASYISVGRDRTYLDNHLRPQADFVVPGAKVGRFEKQLNSEYMRNLVTSFGAPVPAGALEQKNASGTPMASGKLIPADCEQEIMDFYARDFELFGY